MAMKPETAFRNNVVSPFLKTLKNTAVLPIQQRAIRGSPDYVLCSFGTFVGLELKSDGGALSPLQEYNKSKIEKAHGVWITASPQNWAHVKNKLTLMDEGE